MRFPPSLLDDIRARLPVSAVVGRRVKLVKSGREWKGLSPFQQEKTPSFYVNDQKGFYHCFSSGRHGDIFRFVTETEGLTFPEAVERLAQEAGVSLPVVTPEAIQQERKRKDLYDVMELAAKFFEAQLQRPIGAAARAYLDKRQFSDRTQAEFRMGYAPDGRDTLLSYLRNQGITDDQLIDCGLVVVPEEKGRAIYDRFRNRLMIPIQDGQGRVVAFGGRVLDPEGKPKYLNSPETVLFKKGFLVFNGHRAREPAFKAGTIIATEGYLDAIAVHQAGLRNVVATLGTAFTEEQIATLWRYAPEPVICFDGDRAGVGAANRAIDRILPVLKTGFSFRFAFLPEGQDPDDMIKAKGIEAFADTTARAIGLWDALWRRETDGLDLATPERQAMFDKRMQELVAQIGDPLVKRRYELQSRLRVSQLIWEVSRRGTAAAARLSKKVQATSRETISALIPADAINIERIFLGLCIQFPDLAERQRDRIVGLDFKGVCLLPDGSQCRFQTFVSDVMRVIDDEGVDLAAADKFRAFYNQLNPEFMEALDDLHGRESLSGLGGSGQPWGYRLSERFPALRSAPPESFIERCFAVMLARLEHRTAREELARLWQQAPDDADEGWFERVVATKTFVENWEVELFEAEQALDQEAEQIVKVAEQRPRIVAGQLQPTFVDVAMPERISAAMARSYEESAVEF
jgi:DNA primase